VPEDFQVEEVLGFEPDGTGAHALLTVEKRGANTGWVAAQLARTAGVPVRDVGFAGHKDRQAVTRQAYSIPVKDADPLDTWLNHEGEGYRVVAAQRHGRKLRPGAHRANRFTLRVRELTGDRAALEAGLARIAALGVPNYFGPQRFGRDGANLDRARHWAGGGPPLRDRTQRSFALSAARSHVFNTVLAARVRRGDWNRLLPGEAVMLDGRRSFFAAPSVDATLLARCEAMDVHPSGPLPGRGAIPASAEALAIEEAVQGAEAELVALLGEQGLEHERRSLRLPVREFGWRYDGPDLLLEFTLPRGTFATAVLHEVLADAWDVGDGGED
jgi:tRNA pseudouridine13 synthase